ncbi:MAG TPA: Uma2 family endonuclease [Fuerstia sp.]|nr:Uma2 family endonuclease [Fuerstiella sp.]
MSTALRETKRWTRQQYHHAATTGVFENEKVELISGEILVRSPMDAKHATGIQLILQALHAVASTDVVIRVQLPLALSVDSEPELDLSVVAGKPRDYSAEHPTTAALVVEVSHSSLRFDQTFKRRLYASHGIPEYWILNLLDQQLEVHQNPADGDYTDVSVYAAGAFFTSSTFPDQPIAIGDLLP